MALDTALNNVPDPAENVEALSVAQYQRLQDVSDSAVCHFIKRHIYYSCVSFYKINYVCVRKIDLKRCQKNKTPAFKIIKFL